MAIQKCQQKTWVGEPGLWQAAPKRYPLLDSSRARTRSPVAFLAFLLF